KAVVYQAEPVAVVLAETNYHASDAGNMLDVDYEQLPAVMAQEKALEANSPKVHSGANDNVGWDLTYIPDDAAVMKEADVVVKQRILQQRLAPTSMETRGVLAEYSKPDGTLTVWMSSQSPHFVRLFLAGAMGIPETRIRVISPDVGGYLGTFSAFQSCACLLAGGAYNWKHVSSRTVGVLTNRVPTDPYRGAGRPEATHLCERMIDLLADGIKMDPAALRRKNFIS